MKKIVVVGAGIVGICTAYFLQKSGFKVTIIDKEDPGTMTSYGHACTFADYASIPVNSPSLFRQIPSMLFKKDSPLAVDFFYVIKHLPWAIKFLNNCRKDKVEEIRDQDGNFEVVSESEIKTRIYKDSCITSTETETPSIIDLPAPLNNSIISK